MGGIDIRSTMQGPTAGVREEVRTRLAQLGGGGGYILAPANHLQWDVPTENVFALFEEAGRGAKRGA
jgi:uroporphyrinogen decarboxylase